VQLQAYRAGRVHWGVAVALVGLSAGLLLANWRLVHSLSYPDSDFFAFWLAGRMTLERADPYSPALWLDGHSRYGSVVIPNPIFPYPLPLAVFLTPLGLLPLDYAFTLWIYLSEVAVATSALLAISLFPEVPGRPYIFPLLSGAYLFRATLVTFRNGQLGAFLLLVLAATLLLWERQKWLYGGALAAMLLFKPSVGLPLLAFLGLWLLLRKNGKAILGIGLAGLLLFTIGAISNPGWVLDFLRNGQGKLSHAFGYSPSLWGGAGAACYHELTCTFAAGVSLSLVVVAVTGWFLWKYHATLTASLTLALIIPAALLVAPYIWAYDQILLALPIAVVTMLMARQGFPFLLTALVFLFVGVVAWAALALAISAGSDAVSALIPAICWFLAMWIVWQSLGRDAPRPQSAP
jgi:hypothetical protein